MPSRRVVFQTISIVVVVFLVAVAILALYVYKESVGRFEIRRVSLPTRIYADYTPLQPGTAWLVLPFPINSMSRRASV